MKRRSNKRKEGKEGRSGVSAAKSAATERASSARPLSPARKWLFRFAAIFLVPLFLFGLVEVALRVSGYGYSTAFFKTMQIGQEKFLVENDKFSLRFFPPELARTPGPIRMKPEKPPTTYRIFTFGESAAMGDPEPSYGAARYLEALLRERYPQGNFEFVNTAFTAINSHVILPAARECASQKGDLWLIYMGNNEMVGPFGAATVFGWKTPPLALIHLNLTLQKTRLGQLVMDLGRRLRSKGSGPASWGGMQMFIGNQVPPNAPGREAVYRNFRSNLAGILAAGRRSGAQILLNTMAVNLKDCPPFASFSTTNVAAPDREAFEKIVAEAASFESQSNYSRAAEFLEKAVKVFPASADAQFHYGKCELAMGHAEAGAAHLQAARDLDTLPFRTDSRLNAIIQEAARRYANPKLHLFDAAGWIATNSADSIPGQESFYEHVHFNFDGNYRLALGWAEQVAKFLPAALTNRAAAAWTSQEICERRLGLTDWNRVIVVEGMVRRMRQPPLSAQGNNAQRMAQLEKWSHELRSRMQPAAAGAARELYLESLRLTPDDYCLSENFGSFLVAIGDIIGATAQWRRVHELIPQDYLAQFRVGELLGEQNKLSEAREALNRAAAMRPYNGDPWVDLGKLDIIEKRYEAALEKFARARQSRGSDPDLWYQTGRALALLNRRAEAIEQFRRALELNPAHWQAHDALGGLLGLEGNIAEARKEFERVVQLQPNYGRAHLNLGVALLKQGQAADAVAQFQEVLRLEPTNSVAAEYLKQANKMP